MVRSMKRTAFKNRPAWAAAVAAAAIVAVAIALGASTSKSASPDVAAGLQATPAPWPAEHKLLARRLAGLSLPAASDVGYHVHAFVAVFLDGRPVRIPANVGIDPGRGVLAPIHTHDSSGIVHLESTRPYPFTLGQLFTVWGVRFTGSRIGAYRNSGRRRLAVFADGRAVRDPVHYVLRRHDRIVVGFGAPRSFPHRLRVVFPPGL